MKRSVSKAVKSLEGYIGEITDDYIKDGVYDTKGLLWLCYMLNSEGVLSDDEYTYCTDHINTISNNQLTPSQIK